VSSTVISDNGSSIPDPRRTSSSAFLYGYDPIVSCLSKRVSEFQGYHPELDMEAFQLTRYQKGQSYGEHYDWFHDHTNPHKDGANRLTTMFGILEAECENCGTMFPMVKVDWQEENPLWCSIVDW
jgi:prolyl 4-hydroxylase